MAPGTQPRSGAAEPGATRNLESVCVRLSPADPPADIFLFFCTTEVMRVFIETPTAELNPVIRSFLGQFSNLLFVSVLI